MQIKYDQERERWAAYDSSRELLTMSHRESHSAMTAGAHLERNATETAHRSRLTEARLPLYRREQELIQL